MSSAGNDNVIFPLETYVLLVWEEVPDDTRLYFIPQEEANKYENYLREAHNCFINVDDMNDGLRFLNVALANPVHGVSEPGFEQYLGIWHNYDRYTRATNEGASPITNHTITAVYVSGFYL